MKNGLIIDKQENKKYYLNDKLHRTDGPAVEYVNGTKSWWINGKRHRENGPAKEYANGDKEWYQNGSYHREDGPAVEFYDEEGKYEEWWYRNKYIPANSLEEFQRFIKLLPFI